MNIFEDQVDQKLEEQGWTVLKRGWPDRLCWRTNQNGKTEVCAIEIKNPATGDQLSPDQIRNHAILNAIGLPVYIVRDHRKALDGSQVRSLVEYQQDLLLKVRQGLPKIEKQLNGFLAAIAARKKVIMKELDEMESRYKERADRLAEKYRNLEQMMMPPLQDTKPAEESPITFEKERPVIPTVVAKWIGHKKLATEEASVEGGE
jgi:hypothetical protein